MRNFLGYTLALIVAGCASGPPFVDRMQSQAMDKAVRRAQFTMGCPTATGEVINRQQLEPLLFGGPIRAHYTIGVSGCDKRMTVAVLCSENNDQCVEGEPRG
jgi:hypothetical protein